MPDYFVHEKALCETSEIGSNTRIWAFAHILPGAVIGSDCHICDGVFIEAGVRVGNRVIVKCGVQLWDGIVIEDDVFIGPNATFTNDKFPRSKVYPKQFVQTSVRKGATIGANSTILPGMEIGVGSMVGAGAVVTRSVPPFAIAVGNPARIVGYVDAGLDSRKTEQVSKQIACAAETAVSGVRIYDMPLIKDMRGNLTAGEFLRNVPFIPKRYFLVFDVPSREIRGEHAHLYCHQFLVCLRGSCNVVADDGRYRREFVLDSPKLGLYLPPLIWGIQYKYSTDAMLLVFASDYYEPEDYVRDYTQFIEIKSRMEDSIA